MPSVQDLINLDNFTEAALRAAEAAEAAAKAANEAVKQKQMEYDAAVDRAAEAKSRLEEIEAASNKIPAAETEVKTAQQELADLTSQLVELEKKIAEVEAEIERLRSLPPSSETEERIQELLGELDMLRAQRASLLAQQQTASERLTLAKVTLAKLKELASQLNNAKQAVADADAEVSRLDGELDTLKQIAGAAQLQAASARGTALGLDRQRQLTFDGLFSDLQRDVPIALLPVRIETRFHRPAAGQPPDELLIRIYPDDIHQDTHELALTSDEEGWGKHFWRETWRAGLAASEPGYSKRRQQELAAWQQIAAGFGPARAAYIRAILEPTNKDARPKELNTDPTKPLSVLPQFTTGGTNRPSSWTRAARARALPDRWQVIAYPAGQTTPKTKWGKWILEPLHTGPDPSAASSNSPSTASQPSIPVDPGMLWMVDFKEAEDRGMGIRLPLTGNESTNGFDRLIVLGIKGTLNDPKEGADELTELLNAHRFTWGCGFVPQGTPTNNTETVRSGYSREDIGFETSFKLLPQGLLSPTLRPTDDGAQAALALGLDKKIFVGLRHADAHDQHDAENMNRVLWPVTIGYYLEQILNDTLSGYRAQRWREYFATNVYARGPLPVLRVGRQPYGLLPVTSLDKWVSDRTDLVSLIKRLREIWRFALSSLPYAGRLSGEIGLDLVEALGQEALSSRYSWRWARGPEFSKLFWQMPGQVVDPEVLKGGIASLQAQVEEALKYSGLPGREGTRLSGMTFARIPFEWQGPLVDLQQVSETELLKPNYISYLLDFNNVLLDNIHQLTTNLFSTDSPQPLLQRLLFHATLLAYAEQVLELTRPHNQPQPVIDPPWFEPELIDMMLDEQKFADTDQPVEFETVFETPTFWRVLKMKKPEESESLGDALRAAGIEEDMPEMLLAYLKSLRGLEKLPTAALERLLAETLDLASHRLDAWITSLATYRLKQFRSSSADQIGIYLGGYGWVEHLRPRGDLPLSDGFIHAPSNAQAKAAAVLRSGYLTHKDQPEGARLEMDLSSKRVRLALNLIDGVREGQPLGALLGYRLERRLHVKQQNGVIARLRELAPLAGGQLVPKDLDDPQEAIAANNVVDGLKLLERYQKQGEKLLVKFSEEEKTKIIIPALDDIQDAVDAVGDLGLTESVFQALQGNYLRAGGTADAISRGETPSEIQVVETPQSGVAFTQRIVALFNTTPAQASNWSRARAKAEPVLNAWAEQLLGDPKNVLFHAEYFNPGTDPLKDAPDDTKPLNLSMLDLCALDIVYAPPITNIAQQAELELRLARLAIQKKPNGIMMNARVKLVFARNASFKIKELSFPELFELGRAARELFTNSRALDAPDLAAAGTRGEAGISTAALKQRLAASMEALEKAEKDLHQLFEVKEPTSLAKLKAKPFNVPASEVGTKVNLLDLQINPKLPSPLDFAEVCSALDAPDLSKLENLRDALEAFSAFSVQGAVPTSISSKTDAERKEARKELVTQAQRVYAQLKNMDIQLSNIKGTNPKDLLAKLAVLFGEGFRILPPFTLSTQAKLKQAMQHREDAMDSGMDKTFPWLQTVARVRDGARRLVTALTYGEVAGGARQFSLRVAQFPFGQGDSWNLPNEPATNGATCIVALAPSDLDPTASLAGLMIDEWNETIPSRVAQTALAVHYDAPGACAPQAILLAVLPDINKPWDAPTLAAILNETLDLAQLRLVDYDSLAHVGHLLPALFLANNVGGDPNGDTVSSYLG